MRPPHPLVKTGVVASFILLLSSFVAYRSGYFDRYLYSTNGGNSLTDMQTYQTNPADTGKNPTDTIPKRVMMPGSKSLIIADYGTKRGIVTIDTTRPRWFMADSVMKQYQKDKEKEMVYMSSSKSGAVISPTHPGRKKYPVIVNDQYIFLTAPQIDSLQVLQPLMDPVYGLPDTLKKEPVRIYSTKSAPIIRSSDLSLPKKEKKKNKKKNNQPN